MRGMLSVFAFVALTAVAWGGYGPVLHVGQQKMGQHEGDKLVAPSRLRPFVCVGLAYFGIAVLVPGIVLATRGEVGHWSARGMVWSLAAGAAGALGALGIILALSFRGNPIYVMPLVFGGAPVVNTFFSMLTSKSYRSVGPFFLAGLILVVAGAACVLIFKPATGHGGGGPGLTGMEWVLVPASIALTALSWGVYGPVLHWGQSAMAGSRLRPLICVGLAYFLIAVLIPLAVIAGYREPGQWNVSGTLWSLGGGAAGAIGALGIIMAFNFGGKPIYVMPLVFGGAPVVNTFVSMWGAGQGVNDLDAPFLAGLIMVVIGAVTVLVFAPKGGPAHKPPAPPPEAAAKPAAAESVT